MSVKSEFQMMKESQWYTCKFLVSTTPFSGAYQGFFKKNTEGYATVLANGKVILWKGKGLHCTYDSIEEAKQYATCIKKTDNRGHHVADAWDRVMF